MNIKVELKGRDYVEFEYEGQNQDKQVKEAKIIACSELLTLLSDYKNKYGKNISSWPFPSGVSHAELIVKELILKANNNWSFPYSQDELCHCRAISAEAVDQAIVAGAHKLSEIKRITGASTACGTCQPDIEKILQYRLGDQK